MSVYIWPPVSVTTIPPTGVSTLAEQQTQTTALGTLHTDNGAILTVPSALGAGASGILGHLSAIWNKLVTGTIAISGTVSTTPNVQTGSFDEDLTVTTTPETFIAPANAFACFIETKDTNPKNIRVVMGGLAGVASGIQFQPGRSEFYQGGSNISYCNESGIVGEISVQWFKRV